MKLRNFAIHVAVVLVLFVCIRSFAQTNEQLHNEKTLDSTAAPAGAQCFSVGGFDAGSAELRLRRAATPDLNPGQTTTITFVYRAFQPLLCRDSIAVLAREA